MPRCCNVPPDVSEAIEFKGTHNGSKQFPGIIVGESETISLTCTRVVLLHRICQATYTMHDRNTAIAHCNQLTQPARLKARRHQEHITSGIDPLCQFGIEGKENGYLFRVTRSQVLKHLVVVLVADAQDDKLNALSEQWLGNLCQQVKSFLVGETRDHCQ